MRGGRAVWNTDRLEPPDCQKGNTMTVHNNNHDTHRISIGNAEHFQATRGWFMGPFIDQTAGVRHAPVEVKWSTHPEGDARHEVSAGGDASTVTILISGHFEVIFPGGDVERVELAQQGDFAAFGPGVAHTWRALAPSVMLTVRWRQNDHAGLGG